MYIVKPQWCTTYQGLHAYHCIHQISWSLYALYIIVHVYTRYYGPCIHQISWSMYTLDIMVHVYTRYDGPCLHQISYSMYALDIMVHVHWPTYSNTWTAVMYHLPRLACISLYTPDIMDCSDVSPTKACMPITVSNVYT